IFSAFIFMTLSESDQGLTAREGVSLIMLYFLFVMIETYVKTVAP
ncbi:MAG: hypothetical protein HGA85_08880, partial [Nanoarchaeota archaeon]|nr:hypothetical protein [Nanoarchaeota archaeon]